jgi:hypothetical protein
MGREQWAYLDHYKHTGSVSVYTALTERERVDCEVETSTASRTIHLQTAGIVVNNAQCLFPHSERNSYCCRIPGTLKAPQTPPNHNSHGLLVSHVRV